jgi:hypothetical protein
VTFPIWVTIRCTGDGHTCAREQAAPVQRDFPREGTDEPQGIELDDTGDPPCAFVHIRLSGATLSSAQRAFIRGRGASYQYWGLPQVLARRGEDPADPGAFANWLALQQDSPGYDWTWALFLYGADCLTSPALAVAWLYCIDGAPARAWWAGLAGRVERRQRQGLPLDKAALQQELEVVMDEQREGSAPGSWEAARENCAASWPPEEAG